MPTVRIALIIVVIVGDMEVQINVPGLDAMYQTLKFTIDYCIVAA